mmetsp:Transcript_31888/g.36833  ORF Transcript_31888/g.36833 Transcript_31888/m.36833 type:complete len:407 (-) Transcript_31888:51-1271(-)
MISSIVERLHASQFKFNIITTGAGGSLISTLMAVPGCSKTLINAQVPYSTKSTRRILDNFPQKYVCSETSRQLAQHAYEDAYRIDDYATPQDFLVGIGATSAIQTDRTRRSDDQVFVSVWTRHNVKEFNAVLDRTMTRGQQEEYICRLMLKVMADVAGVEATELPLPSNVRTVEHNTLAKPIASVLNGTVKYALFNSLGEVRMPIAPFTVEGHDYENTVYLLYPGSFKPLHYGHTELARVAALVMQRYFPNKKSTVVTYEISASIVGKRDVCEDDFAERIKQFTSQGRRVAITSAKLFVEKAEMFPNHGLVVGIDTARRVIDPQYYNNDEGKMIEAIRDIERFGCYFVVGGRKHGDSWDDLSCLVVPEPIRHLFKAINPHDFRVDISSTEIRARRMSTDNISGMMQ